MIYLNGQPPRLRMRNGIWRADLGDFSGMGKTPAAAYEAVLIHLAGTTQAFVDRVASVGGFWPASGQRMPA